MGEHKARRTGYGRTRWSEAKREAFFNHIAATCHIKQAAEVAGVPVMSVYVQRRKDPEFAAQWEQALAAGYQVLETMVVGHVLEGSGGREIRSGGMKIDIDLALRLLSHHRNAMTGKPPRGGPRLQRSTAEETDAAILKKLEVFERRLAAAQ